MKSSSRSSGVRSRRLVTSLEVSRARSKSRDGTCKSLRTVRAGSRLSSGGAGHCKEWRPALWQVSLWRAGTVDGTPSSYRRRISGWLLWVLALVLGFCVVPFVLWWVLPAGHRRWKGAVAAILPALLVILTQTGLAATGGPSLHHAQALAARGQSEEALRESAACFDLGIEAEAASLFHDLLQLQKVSQAQEPQKAWEAASLPFLTQAGREQAQAHAVEVTLQASTALKEQGDLSASAALLDSAPVEIKQIGPVVGLRRRLYLEEALPLWKVIESRRKSLADRLAACTAIAPHVKGLASLPAVRGGDSLSEEEVAKECESLREQRQRDIERQQEAEAREAERARRKEEAARESALRRWSSAPLLCNDGTPSPSCVCGGSHRGCCSHHGGVAGCSAGYP
jgi:hypothetical protein